MTSSESGSVYVVATPIGNMGDMGARAIETLAAVDCIYAEDTRQTHKLLQHFAIHSTVYQLHKHNEAAQKHAIAKQLDVGKSIAIVSDAGTPLIADPGYVTIAHLRALGHQIFVVPGCSSVVAALSISGLPSDTFQFAGFIPSKPKQRQTFLQHYQHVQQTTVFFETPHRIAACLADCLAIFGSERQLFIGRELSKQFEESTLLPLADATDWLTAHDKRQKGEFVLALAPADTTAEADWQTLARLMVDNGISSKTTATVVSSYTGAAKKTVYAFVLSLTR
ncbi:MAG: 16S rRNA (cytidine(1402)-2'-O)-methyltransferase [Gammaproteobacteria bacterium]|nr:MAG: 16S rRNA (cytidine(1402)-2'-O)-methyltransferase [Gammaproteobacteria bacterium]